MTTLKQIEEENWHDITGHDGMCACGTGGKTCGERLRFKIEAMLGEIEKEIRNKKKESQDVYDINVIIGLNQALSIINKYKV